MANRGSSPMVAPLGYAAAHGRLLAELAGALHQAGVIDLTELLLRERLLLQQARFEAGVPGDVLDAYEETVRVLEIATTRR